MTSTSGGLGRGLAAILTAPPSAPPGQTLVARLAANALDTLQSAGARRLCGYIHALESTPEVHLRTPELRSLHPTQAYQLFGELSVAAALPAGCHPLDLPDIDGAAVVGAHKGRRNMFFFGGELDSCVTRRLATFAEIYAPVMVEHALDAAADERVHLVLDQSGSTAHAEVMVGGATGFGSSPSSQEAIARAAVAAAAPRAKLCTVGETRDDRGGAAVVVAAGEAHRLRMGAAPISPATGPASAVAVASVRAARALVRAGTH